MKKGLIILGCFTLLCVACTNDNKQHENNKVQEIKQPYQQEFLNRVQYQDDYNYYRRSSSESPDDAYDNGYDQGYEDGRNGYGYDENSDYYDYYQERYEDGYEDGYNSGKNEYDEENSEYDE